MVFCGFVPLGYMRVIVPTDVSEVQVSRDFFFFFKEKKVTLSIYQWDHAVAIACGFEP